MVFKILNLIVLMSVFTLMSCEVLLNTDKSYLKSLILNGYDAEIGEAPYIVSLKSTPHGEHDCGGSIISKSVILTAAHCLKSTLYVVAGLHKQNNETDTQIVKVKKQIGHEKYEEKYEAYDIALLVLEKPLKFNSRVQSIELPKVDSDITGDAKYFGWGLNGYERPNILQTATTNILPHEQCIFFGILVVSNYPDGILCTSFHRTGCKGDSGGPLVKIIDGKPTLAGICSFSTNDCSFLPYPTFFTSTKLYLEWIKENVANYI